LICRLFGFIVRHIDIDLTEKTQDLYLKFYDEKETDVEVIITSYDHIPRNSVLTSCSRALLLDPLSDLRHLDQLGWLLRGIGAKKEISIEQIMLKDSFDEYVLSRFCSDYARSRKYWHHDGDQFNDCDEGRRVIWYDILRAKFNYPAILYDLDRVSADELPVAREFCRLLQPKITELFHYDTCKQFSEDYIRAMEVRKTVQKNAVTMWESCTSQGNPASVPEGWKHSIWFKQLPRLRPIPFVKEDFHLLCDNAEQYQHYHIPSQAEPGTEVYMHYLFLEIYGSHFHKDKNMVTE
jgi:hypothetical protein